MEQNFQTSFIPKKPITENRIPELVSANKNFSVGPLTLLTIFIFFAVVLGTGGVFFYQNILIKNAEKMQNNLTLAKNRLESERINQLQTLSKRINVAEKILKDHIAISPIFEILQENTIKTIRYLKFNYNLEDALNNKKILIKMSGQSVGYGINSGYKGIALQADILSKNKNIIEPIFSNLTLDEQGNVLFDLQFYVNPDLVNYKRMIQIKDFNF